jgi:hypothetical protein
MTIFKRIWNAFAGLLDSSPSKEKIGQQTWLPENSVFYPFKELLSRLYTLHLGLMQIRSNESTGVPSILDVVSFYQLVTPFYDGELLRLADAIQQNKTGYLPGERDSARSQLLLLDDHLKKIADPNGTIHAESGKPISTESIFVESAGYGPRSLLTVIHRIEDLYPPKKETAVAAMIKASSDKYLEALNREASFCFKVHLLPMIKAASLILSAAESEGVKVRFPIPPMEHEDNTRNA